MENIKKLLNDDIGVREKYGIFLSSLKLLHNVENALSYTNAVSELLPEIEKNISTFEKNKSFHASELREYVEKYEKFWNEYIKYQIWLIGDAHSCNAVKEILDYEKVHLLGELSQAANFAGKYDYIIACSNVSDEQLCNYERDKVIRYDFLRYMHYGISPQTVYLDLELNRKLEMGIEGAVTGLSYEQRGLDYSKIKRNLACLAAPSQDLYLDYKNYVWLYDEAVNKRNQKLKYCVIGMDFYRLWYDLSKSDAKIRMLCFYNKLKCVHHLHDFNHYLIKAEEDLKVCKELMIDDYLNRDYLNNFHPELYYGEDKEQYEMTEEVFYRDSEEVKKVFHKPYPATFQENIGILESFLRFLQLRKIKTLVYIPPFPEIFNRFTSKEMKQKTLEVISELRDTYEFDFLDLSEHELFTDEYFSDWCHLNSRGARAATELLNNYMDEIWD